MSRKRLFSGIALAAVLAACGEAGRDPIGPSDGPSLDGGLLVGGNKSDSTSTGSGSGSGSGSNTSADDGGLLVGGNK